MDNQENKHDRENNLTKFAYIALVGAPNAGKSTLINQLIGTKIAITSHKIQTSRTRVIGIAQYHECQFAFIDTPGIFHPKKILEKAMVKAAWQAIGESDVTALLVDSSIPPSEQDHIIKKMKKHHMHDVVLILNKIDLCEKEKLPKLAQYYYDIGIFSDIMMISGLKGKGIADFKNLLRQRIGNAPWHYDNDDITDMPDRLLAAEITREKILQYLHQELPYEAMVETISFKESDKDIHIHQNIVATRQNHKSIIIGKNGQKLKTIGQAARQDLTKIFDKKTHLFLHVRIRKDWQNHHDYYREWGLN